MPGQERVGNIDFDWMNLSVQLLLGIFSIDQ